MLGRFEYNGKVFSGKVFDQTISPDFSDEDLPEELPLSSVRILPPVTPTKIVCVGLNYADHAAEVQLAVPKNPILFIKPLTALLAHEGSIIHPPESKQVDYEAELAVVINKKGKHISEEDAWEYILGYTCCNDVTARDLQRSDIQWTRAKSYDTFAPMGPFIVTPEELREKNLSPENLNIYCHVLRDGAAPVMKQCSNTSQFIFKIPQLISFISSVMTLEEGDVIVTGSPPGVGKLEIGDTVEIEIEGIGLLRNTLISEA